VCGGLFHFLVSDCCNKSVNNICDGINESDASICHSRLCHLNFGSMSRLSSLNLILNLSIVKGSKCQSYVQSKQPQKPHKTAKDRHLAPLEFIYSDICEMNGVLTEGGQRYFITMIDDASIYCYVYLLKTKDDALNCFKTYKAKVKNQLEKKIKRFRSDHGGEYFSNEFDLFCVKHDIIHERTSPYSP
jgi:transposase InsO family protein